MNLKRAICVLSFTLSISVSEAVAAEAVSFYLENDSRFTKPNGNTDRHYTDGGKLVYVTQPQWQWLEDFSTWHFGDGEPVDKAFGVFIGQNIYTPDRADEPEKRAPEDRVFAGWLYTGVFAQRATADMLDHVEVNAGVIGPSSHAEQTQNCIHDWIHSNKAIGWDEQLEDEFAADVTFMRQQRLSQGFLKPTEHTDVIGEYGFTLGSVHRLAQAGMTFRCGYNLAGTFGPGRLALPAAISTLRRTQAAYLFVRASAKAIEYDRFLTGLTHEPFVGELQAGFVYQKGRFELGYSQTFLTREFEEQHGKDSYGAITITMLF
ncbi:MAG: lipid A deacylase LpxR family protein [Planctomycetaceae bacterium]|nr:lipid A deacylase LpxR family protein [Planctomycetaceae bacterium]